MCGKIPYLHGKVAIVTGGNSGVGYETAKRLAKHGARVIIASRNVDKMAEAKEKIISETNNADVDYRRIDLASLQSVRTFVDETMRYESRLDVLINNVGAVALPDALTEDGLHVMMQVNYFGAFLLTYLLLPLLRSSAPSRVINVSAATMYFGNIDFEHMNDVGRWSTVNILANSKLASSLFTVELSDRVKDYGVSANSYDPFVVSNTGILDSLPDGIIKTIGSTVLDAVGREKGSVADEVVYLAASEKLDGVTGQHFKFCGTWFNSWMASDIVLRTKLWETSKELVKIRDYEDWEMYE